MKYTVGKILTITTITLSLIAIILSCTQQSNNVNDNQTKISGKVDRIEYSIQNQHNQHNVYVVSNKRMYVFDNLQLFMSVNEDDSIEIFVTTNHEIVSWKHLKK